MRANIFQYTPVEYFQLPSAPFENGTWKLLPPSARDLFTLICFQAHQLGSKNVSLTADQCETEAGLSVNAVRKARNALVSLQLIRATRNRGGYLYELLDPVTGEELVQIQDLRKVEAELVGLYFSGELASWSAIETHQGIKARCPFHDSNKQRETSLHVTFEEGGAFMCHTCDAKGNIIQFEQRMSAEAGRILNANAAYSAVRRKHIANSRTLARTRAKLLAQRSAHLGVTHTE
jgi:hypothetical protein